MVVPVFNTHRLIPAWAGKTAMLGTGSFVIGAHPRVGGENQLVRLEVKLLSGSSPRRRGKRVRHMAPRRASGLIPA